jgi:putative antitoxin of VapBC-like toxin-antitoxin system
MKTTVDIPDEELEEVVRHTRARTKRDAIVTAISDFNRRKRLEKLADQLGTFDNVMSLEELLRVISIIDAVLTGIVDGPFGGRIGGSGFAEPIEAPQPGSPTERRDLGAR